MEGGYVTKKLFKLLIFISSLSLISSKAINTRSKLSLRVQTTYGAISGIELGDSRAFLGVPYAKPPVGNLRWANPQEPAAWSPKVYHATKSGSGCPQRCNDPPSGCPKEISEDCLYLNIFIPLRPRTLDTLPVMVFLHGGNFQSGASSAPMYDGRFLASDTDTIVVVPNYRLGALGYLYLVENGINIGGNFGLKDQELALKFVKENIANFGGNPDKITLVGQSAGAESAAIHYLDPAVSNLFNQIIMLSNPFSLPLKTHSDANKFSKRFISHLECDSNSNHDVIKCLKSKSIEDIVEKQLRTNSDEVNKKQRFQAFQPWGPVVKKQPIERISSEKFDHKPIMMSTVSEEAQIFVYEALKGAIFSFRYMVMLSILAPGYAQMIMREYPRSGHLFKWVDERPTFARLVTDYMFTCPTIKTARELVRKSDQPVYYYVLDQALSFGEAWEKFTWCDGHVCHGGDLAYLFKTASLVGKSYTRAERRMTNLMSSYLGNFFHTGNPNTNHHGTSSDGALSTWEPVGKSRSNGPAMIFSADDGTRLEKGYNRRKCAFWDRVGYYGVSNIN